MGEGRCLGSVIKKTVARSKGNYNLYLVGTGGSSGENGKLRELAISLEVTHPLTQDEARPLLIKIARIMKEEANQHPCSEKYFESFPVEYNNVTIDLYIRDVDGQDALMPYLRVASYYGDSLSYKGDFTPNKMGDYDYRHKETLEEALEKLGESQF